MKKLIGFIAVLTLTSCGMRSIPTALNEVDSQWAQVQSQYKRRVDLIPNLVSTVKGYASHEKETLTAVISARAKASSVNVNANNLNAQTMKQFQAAQGSLSSALSKLMVVVERYPDLKANKNFMELQRELAGTENRITVARKRYIESIKVFNNLVTVPPESWYNSIFLKHDKKPQFQVENLKEVENAPKVQF